MTDDQKKLEEDAWSAPNWKTAAAQHRTEYPVTPPAPITQRGRGPCDICGHGPPCPTPVFCGVSRAGDARRKRESADSLNGPRNRPTPQVTIEAIMLDVRERGIAALKEPATAERLGRCDAAAKAEIERRVAKLRKD